MSVEVMELFNIFSETFGKEKAQVAVRDIEAMIDSARRELATKHDLTEVELRLTKEIEQLRSDLTKEIEQVRSGLTKEIEQVRSGVIKWVAGLLVAQTGVIITILMLLK